MTGTAVSRGHGIRSFLATGALGMAAVLIATGCSSPDDSSNATPLVAGQESGQESVNETASRQAEPGEYGPSLDDSSSDTSAEDSSEVVNDSPVASTTTLVGRPDPSQPTGPSLPDPGEQPADVEAARAEVIAVYLSHYDGSRSAEDRAADVDDPTNIAEATRAIERLFPGAMADARGSVDGVVFVSPTRASVRYRIDLNGSTVVPPSIGVANLVDGVWKVARETVCRDQALGGIDCDTAQPFEREPIPEPPSPPPTLAPAPMQTELPLPGDQQPNDVAAAEGAVVDVAARWFDWSRTIDDRLTAVDDPSGLGPLLETLGARFGRAATDSMAQIEDVVFTSATDAAFLYRINLDGSTVIGPVVGRATQVDGTWKVTRETVCDNFTVGGVRC